MKSFVSVLFSRLLFSLVIGFCINLVADDPFIHWAFDENADNSGSSSGGSVSYDAELHGGPSYTNGTVGSASLALDGLDDYVSVNYTLADQGTIVFWYYAQPWYNYQSVFDNSVGGNDWEMWIDSSGTLWARVTAGNAGRVGYDLDNLNGPYHWYHVAFTWQKNGSTALFVNGTQKGTADLGGGWVVPGSTFYLGGGNTGNTPGNGRFDDFRIYENVLSQADILDLFGQVMAVHLKFDGTSEDIAPGLDNPAVIYNNYAYTNGVDGQALELTDTESQDYVQVEYSLPEQAGSIAMWYRPATQIAKYNTVFDNSVNNNYWEMWTETDNTLTARIRDFSGRLSYDLDNLNGMNHWYHLVYTWDKAAAEASLFVNGRQRATAAIDAWIMPGRNFYLGGGGNENTNRNARWDDVRIYNRAVTGTEVADLFSEFRNNVVYLPFDGNPTDMEGGDQSATLSGDPHYTWGIYSLALDCDGTGDNAAIDYTLTEEGTIAFWYYAQGPWYNYQTVFDNSVNADDWEMWIYNDGRLRFRIDGGIGEVTYDLDNLDGPNNWYHIAVTWGRYGVAKLYVNGVPRGTDAIGDGWVDPGDTVYLAGGNPGNSKGNGIWDDVRIYNYILEASDIAEMAVRPPDPGTVILLQ